MTVKSPFYNKPSTSTSVDSCHKCPLIPNIKSSTGMSTTMNKNSEKVQQNSAGIEQSEVSAPSTNNPPVVEPSDSSVAKSDIGSAAVISCSNCGTTTTPLWRRSPLGETICNACGLYYKARNTTRPFWLKRNIIRKSKQSSPVPLAPRLSSAPLLAPAPISSPSTFIQKQQEQPQQKMINTNNENAPMTSSISSTESSSFQCINCHTMTTPLWRRDEAGKPICNACGLYYKLHNIHRPIAMKKSTIKRRKRVTAATLATHSSTSVHRLIIPMSEEEPSRGIKRRIEETHHLPSKRTEHLRSLLPNLPSRKSSPDPIEPEVFHHAYLPSPPMKPTKNMSNIACLLNPEVDKSERALPSLPSPPLIAYDLMPLSPKETSLVNTVSALFKPIDAQSTLEAHRDELKREVSNLTSLLSRTTAMLQNIDQVIGPK